MSGRVVHFELPADDLERATQFYAAVFDWKINRIPALGATMVGTAPSDERGQPTGPGAINGGMANRGVPINQPVITIEVADIETTLSRIEELGGKRLQEKTPVGDMGFVGYFTDPEGSVVGLWQNP